MVRSGKLRRHRLLIMLSRPGPDGLAVVGEQTVPLAVPLELEISRKLLHRRKGEPEPLGGLSGGPVAVVGSDGEFLLGIIKQGRDVFGSLRVAASLAVGHSSANHPGCARTRSIHALTAGNCPKSCPASGAIWL